MSGADWLSQPLVAMALCWRLERLDGVAIGLTDHDRDLYVDGLRFRAAPGMVPSAIRHGDADSAATDIAGALTSEAIRADDLLAGRWDGARVALFGVDWSGGGGRVELGEGRLGAVEVADDTFRAELAGIVAQLADRPVAEATSPECRADLGDLRCRVSLGGRRRFARIVAADGAELVLDTTEPVANAYGGGRLRWFGGPDTGLQAAIAASAGSTVTLRAAPPRDPAAGTLVELVEGCDKRIATCAARFNNAANFRGEPYLPGIDLLTRYPGA